MRSEAQIKRKLKQVRYRTYQRLLREALRRKPRRCRFHDVVEFSNGKKVGVCRYREISGDDDWYTTICDGNTHEGREQANSCKVFERDESKEEIKARVGEELDAILYSGNVALIAHHYPDLMALLWVLGDDAPDDLSGDGRESLGVDEEMLEDLLRRDPNELLEELSPRDLAGRVVLDLENVELSEDEDPIITSRDKLFQTFLLFIAAIAASKNIENEGLSDGFTQGGSAGDSKGDGRSEERAGDKV